MDFLKKLWSLPSTPIAGIADSSKDETTVPADLTLPTNLADSVAPTAHTDLTPTSDITAFFDPLFAQELQRRRYIADAKKITLEEVKGITQLDVSESKLTSLRGIEYFESLKGLDCTCNRLKALDVSKNTALTRLYCGINPLMALDVSQNTALTHLGCDFTHNLTALDVSKNTALTKLDCYGNQLASLDVSKNTALTELNCCCNKLTELDISQNTALTELKCHINQLTALDVSKNTKLKILYCEDNPGDGTVFPVTAWFDNDTTPDDPLSDYYGVVNITTGSWDYDGTKITVDYRKVE